MKKFIKATNWFLAGMLVLFGFSNCEKYPPKEYGPPEYGTPRATYILQEKPISQQDSTKNAVDSVLRRNESFALTDE